MSISRRAILQSGVASLLLPAVCSSRAAGAEGQKQSKMKLGLVTYNWGKDWGLASLIQNCAATGYEGVELRSTHQHGVEIQMPPTERREVKQRFADSGVSLVGIGTACEFHSTTPEIVQKNIKEAKQFVQLCSEVGGSGIKVRPNGLPSGVSPQKTLEQIGDALQQLGEFAAGFGVDIRLEVHGPGTSELSNIKSILEVADHPRVVACWNCNASDLHGEGLEANFRLIQDRIGIVHIHDLRSKNYPYAELFPMLKANSFEGWTLLEEGKVPSNILEAMRENRGLWEELVR